MTQFDLFAPAPAPIEAAPPLRTIYRGCARDALHLYLSAKARATAKRMKRRKGRELAELLRLRSKALRDEALLLLDSEAMLWPRDVVGFVEGHAQMLAALYAERDAEAAPC
jgi:hypothetical protein